ncbi:MAG: DegT/DnrJ/EryC1/StrS family aminotransferase [Spirochaetes bacterium]|nr:DegT/DnrJ/EryC1/StrS family aminotransferase [Spirochaetota bacterium]
MENNKFEKPIYVTRPLLPPISDVTGKLEEIWASQWLTNNGAQHQSLEKEIQSFLKVPNTCLFNNGTIGLIVAIQSLRLSGEVITTPFTFPATPHVLTWNGITPIFCDIDEQTMNIDAGKIESMITPRTTAILAVHVFGVPCDVAAIETVARRYGLKVIYDAAHAFGTEINGRGIGTFGDISMFSFHATKLFHTVEGGCLTFNDSDLKQRIDLLKNFGIKNEDEVVMPGINGKMNEVQAGIGRSVLTMVPDEMKKRRHLRDIYNVMLGSVSGIRLQKEISGVKDSYQYYVIRIVADEFGMTRDEVYERLQPFNVFTRKYFYPLASDYTCYRQIPSSARDNLPVASQVVQETLSLPFYGGLSEEDVRKISSLIIGLQGR